MSQSSLFPPYPPLIPPDRAGKEAVLAKAPPPPERVIRIARAVNDPCTPERLEEYLREKGWEKHAEISIWRRVVGDKVRYLCLPFTDLVTTLATLGETEQRPEVSVLYNLLSPEQRGELVKAVFPGLSQESAP